MDEERLPRTATDTRNLAEMPLAIAAQGIRDFAVVLIDRDRTIVSWNDGAEQMTGWRGPEVVGQPYEVLYTRGDRETRKPEMDMTIAVHEGSRHQEWRRLRSDGSAFRAEVSLTSIRNADGVLLGFLEIARDISERQKRDEENERVEKQLLVSDRMAKLGQMAAALAHEINNPLAFVVVNVRYALAELAGLGASEALASGLRDVIDALDNAREGAERIQQTAKDLKVFSRADEAPVTVVDVRRVLDSCANMALNEIRHRAQLVKCYAEVPGVDASEARVGQVFLNLILNAAHAIAEGNSEQHEIRLSTRTLHGQVVVEISDTGCGIAPEQLDRIFDPFFTTKPVGVGTGLGLPICKRIVGELHGSIEVESGMARGSTFRVTLPASRGAVASAPLSPPAEAGRRGRVLVIDDDAMLVDAVRRVLDRDHEVFPLLSARPALERIASGESFDAVICDLMMPDLAGADFFQEVFKIDPGLAKRVLFLTAGAFTPRARAFLEGIDNPRLEKPFEPNVLRGAVRKLVGR